MTLIEDPVATLLAIRDRPGEVVGSPTPRVSTARPAGRSRGPEVVAFARDVLDVALLPWQRWVLEAGMIELDGRWASRTVSVMVARQNGKTRLTTVRALAGMVLWGEQVVAASQNRDIALDAWRDALELAEDAELGVKDIARTNGREQFCIGRARYKVVSSTRRGGRGLSADLVILDEVREYRDTDGFAALEKTRRARRSSQAWAISNEGDDGSIVLNHLAEQGRTSAESGLPTDSAWFEWSAPPEAARHDPAAWAAANPAMGHLIPLDVIRSEAAHDDPEVFETEVLCRRVAALRPWIAQGSWDATADPYSSVPDGAEGVVFALDAGPELRHASIAVAWKRPDGRIYVELVEAFPTAPVLGAAAERLIGLVERWNPSAVLVVGRSASEAAALRALDGSGTPIVQVTAADLVRATNAFHEAVVARTVVHPPDPLTSAHVASVVADGVLRRRSSSADIDAAVACVLARHGTSAAPPPPVSQDWTAF